MSQHDYNLSNNTGALFRADLNALSLAIASLNSGATEPAARFPGMLWTDLSGGGDGIIRRRNQANTAWLTDIGQDSTARAAAAAAQAKADRAILRDATATVAERTLALPLILPGTVPTNNEAVGRAQGDLLYQVRLPTTSAGSLLVGAAGGWTTVLAPAAAGALLQISGGVPTWAQAVTVASPNGIVRTKADGTIDASFIPSVASGLRFRGTFRPAVNAEYPTTGGSGSGGVPTIGDFWVIDGLTTGGFTYLTGSLAGVTVYNGDSIALSEGTQWYRMGSSVTLDGYLRADGTTAMTGDLQMAAHSVVNVGGITARAGPPVPLSNFALDATNVIISPQRGMTGADLPVLATGQIGTDIGRQQIYVGAGAVNAGLLPVRFFSDTAAYVLGDYARNDVWLYRAKQAISAGAFVFAQWARVIDEENGLFTKAVTVDYSGYTSLYLKSSGNAADKKIVQFFASGTDGNAGINLLNDAQTVSHGSVQILRAGGHFVSGMTTQNLGIDAQRWGALYLNGGIDVRMNVATITFGSPSNTRRYRIIANITDAADGGAGFNYWTGTAWADVLLVNPTGAFAANMFPLAPANSLGSAGNRWSTLFCRSGVDIQSDVNYVVQSSLNATNRYRILANISDGVDGGWNVQRWDGTAFQDQLRVINNQSFVRSIFPMFDNQTQCGGAGNRWTAVWAVNGTIQTSDARDKTTTPLTSAELDAGNAILDLLLSYRWNAGVRADDLRHYGATAQGVLQAFENAGLVGDDIGAVPYESWPAEEEQLGADGSVMVPAREAGDHYGLNYSEIHSLCLASLHARLTALESAHQEATP